MYAGRIHTLDSIILLAALGIAFAGYSLSGKTSDPYGTFHLALNRLPGEDLESEPRTEWLNMGFWRVSLSYHHVPSPNLSRCQDTDIFPEACEALARKLIEVAQYQDGDNVLDVGHGSGESLILQISGPSVPRPSGLTGITSLAAHHRRSFDRIFRLRRERPELECDIRLHGCDAVFRPDAKEHPLDPCNQAPPYDRILALDCAYHFRTRSDFLRQSHVRLAPGGRIALADICFASLDNWLSRTLVTLVSPMPRENVVRIEDYVCQMRNIGYEDVVVEDITADVFPGFQGFLWSRGGMWRLFSYSIGLLANNGARFVIVSGQKK
ncbi:hypothetical protein OE88DRAFT_110635 [Heliocybe sulcata]|uniref:S-adenosyl-L-methionine-dependent methyltransferase n=1 Tax=Heliocybe sulcata TaxID=5364 RepID=A0A5C3NK00_9AGAM|nr:hypothetical protein OE88DRAFT_110635 [Heliocybe sulcata]